MALSVVHHASVGDRTKDVGGEADRLEQALINSLLNPLQVLQGIVDRARTRNMASLKGAGRLRQHKRAVVHIRRNCDFFKLFGRNLKDVGEAPWASDAELLGWQRAFC